MLRHILSIIIYNYNGIRFSFRKKKNNKYSNGKTLRVLLDVPFSTDTTCNNDVASKIVYDCHMITLLFLLSGPFVTRPVLCTASIECQLY